MHDPPVFSFVSNTSPRARVEPSGVKDFGTPEVWSHVEIFQVPLELQEFRTLGDLGC